MVTPRCFYNKPCSVQSGQEEGAHSPLTMTVTEHGKWRLKADVGLNLLFCLLGKGLQAW